MSKNNPYKLNKGQFKKINYFDQTDTPDGMYRQYVEDFNEYGLYDWELPEEETTGETTNRWDLGRNCPFCAGRLVTAEHDAENDTHLLQCKNCGRRVFASDINYRGEVPDKLYRQISDRTFNKWLEFKDQRNKS